jgi:hypothetical protein
MSGHAQCYAPVCELLDNTVNTCPALGGGDMLLAKASALPLNFNIASSRPYSDKYHHSQPQWHSLHAQCSPPPLARLLWLPLQFWSLRFPACASRHQPPLLDRKYGGDTLPIKRKDEQTRPPTVQERDWARRRRVANSWCQETSSSSREVHCGSLATTAAWYVYLRTQEIILSMNESNTTFLIGSRPHNSRRTTRLRPLLPRPSPPPQA